MSLVAGGVALQLEAMMREYLKSHIPNWITLSRLACTPLLLPLGLEESAFRFLALGVTLMLADALDGALARLWRTTSLFGQYLDGRVDLVFHTVFLSIFLFRVRSQLEGNWFMILVPALCFLIPSLVGRWLTGRLHSVHLFSKKVTSWIYLLWVVIALLDGANLVLLLVINAAALFVMVEEIALYLMLREGFDPRLVSVFQVWHPRKRGRHTSRVDQPKGWEGGGGLYRSS